MYHFDLHFQFALDRSHRFEMAATEYRAIARADAAAPGYAAPELRVPAPISSRPVVIRSSSPRRLPRDRRPATDRWQAGRLIEPAWLAS